MSRILTSIAQNEDKVVVVKRQFVADATYRWECEKCPRVGIPTTSPAIAKRRATEHRAYHRKDTNETAIETPVPESPVPPLATATELASV